ncbi:MAG: branched-chain amino acid ABC transporter permease [Acidimicrobiia bacterium]
MAVTQAPKVTDTGLRPAPLVDLRRASRLGLLAGVAMVLVAAVGMVERFQPRLLIEPFLPLGLLMLFLVPFAFGWNSSQPPEQLDGFAPPEVGPRNVRAGALTGAVGGGLIGLFLLLISTVDMRSIFIELSPRLVEILSFGMPAAGAVLLLVASSAGAGAAGGAVHLLPVRWLRSLLPALLWVLLWGLLEGIFRQLFTGLKVPFVNGLLYTAGALSPVGALAIGALFFGLYWYLAGRTTSWRARYDVMPRPQRMRWSLAAIIVVAVVLAFIPPVMGPFISQILDLAGLYLLMALGLNIVVGYAGLLDLGYVAFFAVGAYTSAILTSPQSPRWSPELTVLVALPFVMLAAALAGIMVATPVLRMRGDYLAIVTLGFGEIARILLNSEWLAPYFGGAQGITNIPSLQVGPITVRSPEDFFYPIFIFVLIAAYITISLQNSRWGRAWMAMREDESVAEAMGVNIVSAKLSAFVVGAILASFGGAMFAHQIGSVFPHSFDIVVSITVLVIIIVGGMGSVPGVVLGALVLIALPNLLREFSEYQFLFYGALLIFMMLKRPEGFIPSKQRAAELHQEEVLQDAWMKIYGEPGTAATQEKGS